MDMPPPPSCPPRFSAPPPRSPARTDSDSVVRGTNDDATLSKLSCVQLGYLNDDYVHHFVRRPLRRAPVINRGYFSRVTALHTLLHQFLEADTPEASKQVVSLGCGFDTTYFQLKAQGKAPTRYIELDYHEVTAKKAAIIANQDSMRGLLEAGEGQEHPQVSAGQILSRDYSLVAADLRQLASLEASLALAGFDPTAPTLFVAECVLVYMEPADSAALLAWCRNTTSAAAAFVLYEQICPDSAFGQQMLINLERRGITLPGIHAHRDQEAQKLRFITAGWDTSACLDMHTIHHRCLDPARVAATNRLELFDEFEEWQLLQSHYCVASGVAHDPAGALQHLGFTVRAAAPPLSFAPP